MNKLTERNKRNLTASVVVLLSTVGLVPVMARQIPYQTVERLYLLQKGGEKCATALVLCEPHSSPLEYGDGNGTIAGRKVWWYRLDPSKANERVDFTVSNLPIDKLCTRGIYDEAVAHIAETGKDHGYDAIVFVNGMDPLVFATDIREKNEQQRRESGTTEASEELTMLKVLIKSMHDPKNWPALTRELPIPLVVPLKKTGQGISDSSTPPAPTQA